MIRLRFEQGALKLEQLALGQEDRRHGGGAGLISSQDRLEDGSGLRNQRLAIKLHASNTVADISHGLLEGCLGAVVSSGLPGSIGGALGSGFTRLMVVDAYPERKLDRQRHDDRVLAVVWRIGSTDGSGLDILGAQHEPGIPLGAHGTGPLLLGLGIVPIA